MVAPFDANKTYREKAEWKQHKNAVYCFKQIMPAAPDKKQLYSHLPLISNHRTEALDTAAKVRINSSPMFYEHLHMDIPVLSD